MAIPSRVLQLTSSLLAVMAIGCAAPRPWAATFDQEAVATDHAEASAAGEAMLRQGGNVVDAAVAASLMLSVVRPESCGLGGGGFMIIHLSETGAKAASRAGREVLAGDAAINYRETAPGAVGPDFFKHEAPDASTRGGKAVAVPGTVAGLMLALDKFGTLDRATVFAPAIRAAEDGFIADEHYAESARTLTRQFESHPEWKTRFASVWRGYLREGAVRAGDRIRLPQQAGLLRLIARDGAAAFYQGPVAAAIVGAVTRDGGVLSADDLSRYAPSEPAPLRFKYRGSTFVTMPPPSSGGVAMAETLGILSPLLPEPPRPVRIGSNVAQVQDAVSWANRESRETRAFREGPLYLHPLVEGLKHAFADRSRWLGDPAFVEVPVERLSSEEYARSRAAMFHPASVLAPEEYGSHGGTTERAPPDHGTSHVSIVDRWGSAVACTETVNLLFGSCILVEDYGLLLNDEMDDFTTQRGGSNAFGLVQSDRNLPAPGKRPLSSMTPTIVLDAEGRVRAVAGASGGPRIISATLQVLLNVLLFEDSAADSVQRARIHEQWAPIDVEAESAAVEYASQALGPCGDRIKSASDRADVQLVLRRHDVWDAACDPRKGGRPAGR